MRAIVERDLFLSARSLSSLSSLSSFLFLLSDSCLKLKICAGKNDVSGESPEVPGRGAAGGGGGEMKKKTKKKKRKKRKNEKCGTR